jgi:hypothetical protein
LGSDRGPGCVEENASDSSAEMSELLELPKPRQGGKLHTLEGRMKGERELERDQEVEDVVDEAGAVARVEFKLPHQHESSAIDQPLEKSLEKSLSTIEVIRNEMELNKFENSLFLINTWTPIIKSINRKHYNKASSQRIDDIKSSMLRIILVSQN